MLPPALTAVATALATLFTMSPASAGPIEERAKAAAEASRARSASSEAIQDNYLTPGLAAKPIMTVDGRTSFTPNIACQKTATFLELMVQPGPTGDLSLVQISRDLDLDGAIDMSAALPVPVAGLCANGLVSCRAGTWNDCHYFRWDVDAARAPKLTEVDLPALAGCYCLNNSCGSNLAWANMPSVLTDLGGGIVGALTSADPRIGVSQAVINGPTIRYVAAQSTACASDPALPQTGYRASPALLTGDAAVAASGSSIFQALTSSPIGADKLQERRSCIIERQIDVEGASLDDVITLVSGGYGTVRRPGAADFLLGSPRDDSLNGGSCRLFDFRMVLRVGDPSRIVDARLGQIFFDDWVQIRVDGNLVAADPASWTGPGSPPAKCERGKTWYNYQNLDLKPFLTRGDHEIWLRVAVGGEGEASLAVSVTVDEGCRTSEQIADTCGSYAANPQCRIADERVDGVETFRNGVKTGLKPLPQTRIVGDGACAIQLSRDFFRKDRSYECEVDLGGVPPPDMSRGAYIIDRSTEATLADRVRRTDGSYAESVRNFGLPSQAPVAACEPICKSRAPRVNTGAAPAGVVGTQQNEPTGFDTYYHACEADNRCPLGPGEELVSACGCLDDFPEAAVMMQTVRLAGADLVCTKAAR